VTTSRFDVEALQEVWKFAKGMFFISALALLLTQLDKILLSSLLDLSEFGYYTIATSLAGILFLLVTPIAQVFYPKFCQLLEEGKVASLADSYHKAGRLVTVISSLFAAVVVFFSEVILMCWTQNLTVVESASRTLQLLAVGNMLNAFMYIPYQIQLAHGWTKLTLYSNLFAVSVLAPMILLLVPKFGVNAAAAIWVLLNTFYIVVSMQIMHKRILRQEILRWYIHTLLIPSIFIFGLVYVFHFFIIKAFKFCE
jgi:O-antigen/teichoic acid export membrane protein